MNSILTVVSFGITQDLTILETVKQELGITSNAEDEKIATWIRQASSAIASHCNRVFGVEDLSEVFRLECAEQDLVLSRFPVVSVTSITENGTVLDADEYEVNAASGVVTRLNDDEPATWYAGKITVEYEAGYTLLDTLPHDIERACITIVKLLRSHATRDPMAKRVEIPDVRTIDYWIGQVGDGGAMPPDIADLLAPYVNRRV